MREYKKMIGVLLAGYLAGMTAARANPADFTPRAVDGLTTVGTGAAFGALVAVLFAYDVDWTTEFPNVVPFAAVMAAAYGVLTIGLAGTGVTRLANIVGVASFVATALTVILTKRNGLDIALVVLLGLPLVLAVPGLVAPRPAGVPETLVGHALAASRLVYSRIKNDVFEEVEFVKNVETGARVGIYVAKSQGDRDIYVSFAGTDSKTGWLKTDLRAVNVPYPYATGAGEVHQGFLDAWKSIREETWTKIADVILRNAGSGNVIVCGHSLGGAMSVIAAGDLLNRLESQYLDRLYVVTFGSPVVGTSAFADWYDDAVPKTVRVAGLYDPVPKTPMSNFVHAGTALQVGSLTATPVTAHDLDQYERSLRESRSRGIAVPAVLLCAALWFLYVHA